MKTQWAVVGGMVGGIAIYALGMLWFAEEAAEPQRLGDEPPTVEQASEPEPAPVLVTSAAARAPDAPSPAPGDLHVTKAEFTDTYRTTFRSLTKQDPTDAQVEASWERLQGQTRQAAGLWANQAAQAELASQQRAYFTARDDIMTVLTAARRKDDLTSLRHDGKTLARLLRHGIEGPEVRGPSVTAQPGGEPLEDGSRVYFPEGAYTLTEKAVLGTGAGKRMPRDLTIEGAGMDRTLITLSDFSARDVVYNLHLKDCTIDCGNDGAFDLRSEKASIFAENVRFVRFDAGHGGCHIFAFSRGGAVYCKDCRFDGGYGRSPGNGSIDRHIQVGRYEGCTFDRISYVIGRHSPALFVDCTFQDCAPMESVMKRALAHPSSTGARYETCRIQSDLSRDGEKLSSKALRRDLKALFPAFRGR